MTNDHLAAAVTSLDPMKFADAGAVAGGGWWAAVVVVIVAGGAIWMAKHFTKFQAKLMDDLKASHETQTGLLVGVVKDNTAAMAAQTVALGQLREASDSQSKAVQTLREDWLRESVRAGCR